MRNTRPPLQRRLLLAGLTGLALPAPASAAPRALSRWLLGPADAAQAPVFPDGATILVAGPDGGTTEGWTRAIVPALGQTLPPETAVRKVTAGGPDGVTGANQFEARSVPDGQTALLVPGQAATAWLIGDPRAQFDAGRWVPVLAGVTPGVMVARIGPEGFGPGGRPRIAASSPAGAELPALLGAELIGAHPVPVFGLASPDDARDALRQGTVDAVFVCGRKASERVAELAGVGGMPVFTLGARDAAGALTRDPVFPDLPNVAEMRAGLSGAAPAGALFVAWGAAAAAAQLDFGLVLPQLTPAAMVALWRRAGEKAAVAGDMQAAAAAQGVRPVGGPGPVTAIASADAPALLALRQWLETRFNWRPT